MVYVFVPVPPVVTQVIVPLLLIPLLAELHDGCVKFALLNANMFGCVTITVVVAVQPFAVVAVTVYV